MSDEIPLIVENEGEVLTLSLNNIEKKNALTSEMMGALSAILEEVENYDLIISNYAFSELNAELQKQSIDKIINKSKYCYMIINSDSFINNPKYKKIKFMSKEEILNNVNNSYVDEEIPLTSKNNYLLLSKET